MTQVLNPRMQRTGASRLAQSVIVAQRRLALAADAPRWAASDASYVWGGRVHDHRTLGICRC